MNRFVKLEGLPNLSFAHAAKFNAYENFLPANENYIEITYIQSGNLKYLIGDECFVARQNDLSCNLFLSPMKVLTPEFHEHHTVCFDSLAVRTDCRRSFFCKNNLLHRS